MTKKEIALINKAFGLHYTAAILKKFEALKIVNTKGEPYSKESIRNVKNGLWKNEELEILILKLAKKTIAQKKAERQAIFK